MFKLENEFAIIAIMLIGLILIALALLVIHSFRRIAISKNSIEFNKDKSGRVDTGCMLFSCNPQKLSLLALKFANSYSIIFSTKQDCIAEQMNYVEQKLLLLREKDLAAYADLRSRLENIEQDKIMSSDSYLAYINITKVVHSEIKLLFKRLFLDDKLDFIDGIEWETYKREKTDYIMAEMNKHLVACYHACIGVPLSKILDDQVKHVRPILKCEFDNVFNFCKKTAKEKAEIVLATRNDLDKFVVEMCNVSNAEIRGMRI